MGRIKKYITEEEKIQAQKEWSKKYYWKNKKECDEKQKNRNYKKRMSNLL